MNPFQTPLVYLKGVGQSRAEVLKKELELHTFEDLLRHFPFRYIDRTRFYKVREIREELPYVQVLARIVSKEIIGEKQSRRLVVKAKDDTGIIELVWFKGINWIEKTIIPGKVYILFGKPGFFNMMPQMAHPEMELYIPGVQKQGNLSLQPVYNSTEKLKQFQLDSKGLQKLTAVLLGLHAKDISENLPLYIINQFKLLNRAGCLPQHSFPGGCYFA
jgi:ATP-dependent DNA helicase RecG